jgi:TetR/AcrR family transcriptional regulator, acrAB operon repressor
MVRRTKEEAAVTRQSLLRAALAVFSRQGYSATRLEDIAAEAKVTRGAIYHHFGSKPELYTEMVMEFSKPLMQIVQDAIEAEGTMRDALRHIFIHTCAAIEDDPGVRAIQEISVTKTELSLELVDSMTVRQSTVESQFTFLIEGFTQGISQGEFRAGLDPDDMALAYFAYLNGMVVVWLLSQQSFSIKARAPYLIDLFLQGMVPPS